MASGSHIRGRDASFRMEDAAGASFGLTGHGNEWTLTHSANLEDATAFGDSTMTTMPVIQDYTVNFSGYWAGSGTDSAACKLHALTGASQGTWFQVNPGGSARTDIMGFAGCVNVENLDIGGPVAGTINWSMSLRPRSGSLTISTASW